MTAARIGHSAEVYYDDNGSPQHFVLLAEAMNIEYGETVESLDATHFASPGARREYILGLIDGGEITLELNLLVNDGSQFGSQSVRQVFNSRSKRLWRIVIPGSSATRTFEFEALITGDSFSVPVGEVQRRSLTLKVTGAVREF